MRYTSTRDASLDVSFEVALTSGYAPDGGLFVPKDLPKLPDLNVLENMSYAELMETVLRIFIDRSEVGDDDLKRICQNALLGFSVPEVVKVVNLKDNLFVSELFHGPTFCFKDLGMRAVIQLLDFFCTKNQHKITLLVSTTGDTGPAAVKAVADATSRNLQIVVHYPHEQISDFQRLQMTTVQSDSVRVVGFEGGGDDMDLPIKNLLLEAKQTGKLRTGVNSYNIVSHDSCTVHSCNHRDGL